MWLLESCVTYRPSLYYVCNIVDFLKGIFYKKDEHHFWAALIEYRNISIEKKTVNLCKTPLHYVTLMHTLPLFYPAPCMPSPLFYPTPCIPSPLFYCTPCIPSPLFCPTPCIPSSYSVLAHACPPLFYPSPCTPSSYSIPAHACPLSILAHLMHALSVFYPSLCMSSTCTLRAHTWE